MFRKENKKREIKTRNDEIYLIYYHIISLYSFLSFDQERCFEEFLFTVVDILATSRVMFKKKKICCKLATPFLDA